MNQAKHSSRINQNNHASAAHFDKSMANVHALHTISGLEPNNPAQRAVDTKNPLFARYPAMKLGCMAEVNWYAEQLAWLAASNIVAEKMADAHNALTLEWVVIAPPYYQLPSAANLLAVQVAERLPQALQKALAALPTVAQPGISLVQPRLQAQSARFNTQAEFDLYYNYSKNSQAQRIKERERVQQSLQTESLSAQLRGKSLLVINDINVTGTQQHFMQQAFNAAGATQCMWLYILNIDAALAKAHPEIEYQINHCAVATPEAFARALQRDDINHTVRCLSRLFNESDSNFGHILSALPPAHCQRLLQLAELEGRYSGELFASKMRQLSCCAQPGESQTSTTVSQAQSPEKPNV